MIKTFIRFWLAKLFSKLIIRLIWPILYFIDHKAMIKEIIPFDDIFEYECESHEEKVLYLMAQNIDVDEIINDEKLCRKIAKMYIRIVLRNVTDEDYRILANGS